MTITIQGQITDIFPAQIFGNFEKREFWVVENDPNIRYPQHFTLECQQGDANMLDHYVPGDVVKCTVDLRGKKWAKNGREGVINTLKCWKIEKVGEAKPAPSTRQQTGGIPPKNKQQDKPADAIGPDDDLPF